MPSRESDTLFQLHSPDLLFDTEGVSTGALSGPPSTALDKLLVFTIF